jgi:MYXO-CTERM domain-containing protein
MLGRTPRRFSRKSLVLALPLASLLAALPARAAVYSYVDWTAADVGAGTAEGTITLPDNSTVTVTFAAINENLTPGTLFGAQTNGGTNFWSPSTPYTSSQVENAPPSTDLLQLSGGQNQTYRVTLSEPIKDPIMAIVSLGQSGLACSYDFDSPFTIVSQGAGYWGGSDTALQALPGDVLEGHEGHGTIQFLGTFSTFSWTVPTPESWHGFTFAIRTTERIEPTPSEGGAGGVGGVGNLGGADGTGVGGTAEEGSGEGGVPPAAGIGGQNDVGVPFPTAGLGGESTVAAGGEANGGGNSSTGGSSILPNGGDNAGGEDDGFAVTKQDSGCNCSVIGAESDFGISAVLLALGLGTVARLRRRR